MWIFGLGVHGIPLMKSSKEDSFRFVRGTIGHRWIPLTESQQCGFIFCISLDKQLNKRSDCQWFETIDAHCDVTVMCCQIGVRGVIFCSKVTTKPCNIKMISTLGTLLGAIECVVVVLAFQESFFHKHGGCILIAIIWYAWMHNDITIILISDGKTIYINAENGVCYLFKR